VIDLWERSVAGEYLIVGTTATDLVPLGRLDDSGHLQALLAAPPAVSTDPPASEGRIATWLQQFTTAPDKGHHDGQ
jgi:flagellar protein FliO/FliZ